MSGPVYVPAPPPLPTFTPEQAREKICPLISGRAKDGTLERMPCVAAECALWEFWLEPSPSFCGIGFCSLPKLQAGERAPA